MIKYNLGGDWNLQDGDHSFDIKGKLPGCNYLDLMNAGKIDDPFWKENELTGANVAEKDYIYSRKFSLPNQVLEQPNIDLVISGLDTLATITLNGSVIAKTKNCHRIYRYNIKSLIKADENTIEILFESPLPYIRERQEAKPLSSMNGIKGAGHIRKVQCHFGWDWGPTLPPCGIFGDIALEAYDIRIGDVQIRQAHKTDSVVLSVNTELSDYRDNLDVVYTITAPSGTVLDTVSGCADKAVNQNIVISKPELWWCNGLGEQPLYTVCINLVDRDSGACKDVIEKRIGLRTIELDTSKDTWGSQFRFVINGVPIFAKGANWIPTDTFVTRTTLEDLEFYIESAKWANMNMIRVWGGGHYESDSFYDLCDEKGILVWQDFAFACSCYPADEPEFIEEVHAEAVDNIKRIRHHASLALWCGNNENEQYAFQWRRNKVLYEANMQLYFEKLQDWTLEHDKDTRYWPGSPSSGKRGMDAQSRDHGDCHLWYVWHGLLPIEAYRKMRVRFCSEFGTESFPSMRAIRTFTDDKELDLFSPIMMAHQKSLGGNEKILYYLIAKYRVPSKFEDFVYLSQLVQSGAMRFAIDEWRRNMGRCNGSLYWQYNDCWPVASWAGLDYCKQYKALHYHARHFNKLVCLSNDYYDDRAELYIANDLPTVINGQLDWRLLNFSGEVISSGFAPAVLEKVQARNVHTLYYKDILKSYNKNEAVLEVTLTQGGTVLDKKNWLLVPDKNARLKPSKIKIDVSVKQGKAAITLSADTFSRYVYLVVDGVDAPLSDNFFDIMGGEAYTVTLPLDKEMSAEELEKRISIKSLSDVEPKNSPFVDSLTKIRMLLNKNNFSQWIGYKFM